MNKRISLTDQAHQITKKHIKSGDTVIDATLGNGHDCAFLAQQIGSEGTVFGFDIQKQAIETTRHRLDKEAISCHINLINDSHCQMKNYIPIEKQGKIQAIMFNLGYLPGGDKSVITQASSTLLALNSSLALLAVNGIIAIMAYPGHSGGETELEQIKQWTQQLASHQYQIQSIHSSEKATAPVLFIIQKNK